MTTDQLQGIMAQIVDLQAGSGVTSSGTAPVTVQVGYVDAHNIVRHDGIRVISAPETITTGLMHYVERLRAKPGERWIGYSIHDGALHIS
jgi:hypothetical protein